MTDQPFWGERVFQLGVGPKPIPAKRITPGRLASALDTVLHDSAIIDQAQRIGEKLQAEDGVGQAVAYIQNYVHLEKR